MGDSVESGRSVRSPAEPVREYQGSHGKNQTRNVGNSTDPRSQNTFLNEPCSSYMLVSGHNKQTLPLNLAETFLFTKAWRTWFYKNNPISLFGEDVYPKFVSLKQ